MTKKATTIKTEIVGIPINYVSKQNSKMPCRSWDLPARKTCPGSYNKDGSIVDVCKKCYASKGTYCFRCVKQVRENNMLAWQKNDWVDLMVEELKNDRNFRFFTSGDGYKIELWYKIYQIAIRSPECNIWIPTRMHKFPVFRQVIDMLNQLKNVVVRFSSDSLDGEKIDGDQTSVVISNLDQLSPEMSLCESYANKGKCGKCRKCWAKDIRVIAYKLH